MIQAPSKQDARRSPGTWQDRGAAWFALLAIGGVLYFIMAVVILHLLRPDLNPITHAVSNYAVGPFGFLMTSAFFVLAMSECALACGLARSLGPGRRAAASVHDCEFSP